MNRIEVVYVVKCRKCPLKDECDEFKKEVSREFKYSKKIEKEISEYCPLLEMSLDLIYRKAQSLNDVFEVEKEYMEVDNDEKAS